MTRFVITIPVRNAEKYIARALRSAFNQDYDSYRIIMIDDASTDKTWSEASKVIRTARKAKKIDVQTFRNKERVGVVANHHKFWQMCAPDEVIVNLDGDDELNDNHVLSYLANVYSDPNVWMTYGSYEYDLESRNPNGDCLGIASAYPANNHTRKRGFSCSHLRTYYAGLAQKIREEDLRYGNDYYQLAADHVIMFPMIEMAGPQHARFIEKVLYQYNAVNPLNEHKDPTGLADLHVKRQAEITSVVNHIVNQPIYPLLNDLKDNPWN